MLINDFNHQKFQLLIFILNLLMRTLKFFLPSFFGEKIRYTENSAHIEFDIRNDALLQSNCSFFEEISEDCVSIIIKGLI